MQQYTMSPVHLMVFNSRNFKIRQRLLIVWLFYRYTDGNLLIKIVRLKYWSSTLESFMVEATIFKNIEITPFYSFCVTWYFVDVCYTHHIWPHRIWLVILLIRRRIRDHSRWSLLFPDTHLGISRVSLLSWVLHGGMVLDFWITDRYFLPYTYYK